MHLKDLLESFVRVGYRIPVPDFYLVLHGLRCRKSTIMDSIIALRFQPIRSRSSRWLHLNNHLLKMNNHLPLQFTPHISVSWMVCRTMTCICFGCSALPPRFSEFIYHSIATSKNILLCFSCDRIEINNLLEVFVQISKTSFGFCNNLGLRPRLLPNPTSVFDICTNTSNSLFISILNQTLLYNVQ